MVGENVTVVDGSCGLSVRKYFFEEIYFESFFICIFALTIVGCLRGWGLCKILIIMVHHKIA